MNYLITIVAGYLIGCISSAVLISKLFFRKDVRDHGSGNPGTSNMMRVFGMQTGLIVMVFDMLKGVLATLLGLWLCGTNGMYYGALASVIGHNWPVFMHFKGGKGVATTYGAMLVILPWWTLGAAAVFLLIVFTTRYFSVASVASLTFIWLGVLIFHISNIPLFLTSTILTVLIYIQHRENFKRLKNGTENRMQF